MPTDEPGPSTTGPSTTVADDTVPVSATGRVGVSGTARRLREAALICGGVTVLLVTATVLVP